MSLPSRTIPPRAVASLAIAALSAVLLTSARAAEDWTRHIDGGWDGEIFSGTDHMPAVTTFTAGPDGVSGRYVFTEDGKTVEGTLSECRPVPPRTLVCRWKDRYGAGTLAATFEESLQRFDGLWSSDDAPKSRAPWWGKRQITS